jgi:hypothetical protein
MIQSVVVSAGAIGETYHFDFWLPAVPPPPRYTDSRFVKRGFSRPYALRNATLISVLAYAGLRPHEAVAELRWEGIGEDFIQVYSSKTKRSRTVPALIKPLMADLAAWKKATTASTAAKALVFPDKHGEPWSKTAQGNFRNREFKPRAPEGARIYDLRHGYASLLIREGVDPAEVAERMGHSLTMTTAHLAGGDTLRQLSGRQISRDRTATPSRVISEAPASADSDGRRRHQRMVCALPSFAHHRKKRRTGPVPEGAGPSALPGRGECVGRLVEALFSADRGACSE